jgi:hypothetical protein
MTDLSLPVLDEGAIRERVVEDMRARLQKACDVVALRAQEFGASCWDPDVDSREASRALVAAQTAYRVLAFDMFLLLLQALHDSDAPVVFDDVEVEAA